MAQEFVRDDETTYTLARVISSLLEKGYLPHADGTWVHIKDKTNVLITMGTLNDERVTTIFFPDDASSLDPFRGEYQEPDDFFRN